MQNLYVIYDDNDANNCAFFTIVIRNEALTAKSPGGIKAFAEQHRPRCNRDLTVNCAMAGDELEPVIEDLQRPGFDRGDPLRSGSTSFGGCPRRPRTELCLQNRKWPPFWVEMRKNS